MELIMWLVIRPFLAGLDLLKHGPPPSFRILKGLLLIFFSMVVGTTILWVTVLYLQIIWGYDTWTKVGGIAFLLILFYAG